MTESHPGHLIISGPECSFLDAQQKRKRVHRPQPTPGPAGRAFGTAAFLACFGFRSSATLNHAGLSTGIPASFAKGRSNVKSLQETAVVESFARNCHDLWRAWLKPKNLPGVDMAGARVLCRKDALKKIVTDLTQGVMKGPAIEFKPLTNSWGSFDWALWTLRIKQELLGEDNVTYETFLQVCRTAYHETRHGEQFYRIAQGLALGALAFPEKTGAELINRVGIEGGVAAKVAAL